MRNAIRTLGILVSGVAAAACASSAKQGDRLLASESVAPVMSAFDSAMAHMGLKTLRANLHSHHYMKVVPSRRARDTGSDDESGDSGGTFPFDDGRSSRNNADGVNTHIPAQSVLDYFKMACSYGKTDGELDVLFVTPHSKNGEEDGQTDTGKGAFVERHPLLSGIAKELGDGYYCGLGQEASSISSGNHITVLGVFPRDNAQSTEPFFFPAGAYDVFYPQVKKRAEAGEPIILELNHPAVKRDLWWKDVNQSTNKQLKEVLNDYGLDDFAPVGCALKKKLGKPVPAGCKGDEPGTLTVEALRASFAAIREAAGDRFRLIEVVSPDGATSNPGIVFKRVHERTKDGFPTAEADVVPDGLYDWVFYLNMGFHLSPVANQDNHHMNWGSAIASRTGILAASTSEKDLLEALNARRTFASEDKNAKAWLASGDLLMGSEITTSDSKITLELGYQDPDAADSKALVKLFYYKDGEALNFVDRKKPLEAMRWVQFAGEDRSQAVLPAGSPEYYFPKDGDPDILAMASGEVRKIELPLQGGLQYVFAEFTQAGDQDKIWTAPIWIRKK